MCIVKKSVYLGWTLSELELPNLSLGRTDTRLEDWDYSPDDSINIVVSILQLQRIYMIQHSFMSSSAIMIV